VQAEVEESVDFFLCQQYQAKKKVDLLLELGSTLL